MMSWGKWVPLQLIIFALPHSSRLSCRGRSYLKSGRSKIRHRTVSPSVKTPRVFAQNGGFVVLCEIGSLQDFVDFFHAICDGNLMVEVRREHEWLWVEACNCICAGLFVALPADETSIGA